MSAPEQDRSYGDRGADARQTDPNGISEPGRAALYRLFGDADVLLYVGITGQPTKRLGMHRSSKPWWPEVQRQQLDWYPDRESAATAEAAAIRDERPRYNIAQPPDTGNLRGTRIRSDAPAIARARTDGYLHPQPVRFPDEDWADLDEAAREVGSDRSAVIRQLVQAWMGRAGIRPPHRPVPRPMRRSAGG